jgi:hypothetical protein
MREITIKPVLNGYIVTVGCQKVVFDCKDCLLQKLSEYLDHPEAVEQEFLKDALNPMPVMPAPEPPCLPVGYGGLDSSRPMSDISTSRPR